MKLINSGRVNLNDLPCTHEEGSTNLSLSLQQLSPEPGSSAYSSSSTLQISEAPSPTNSLHGPDSDNEYDSMYSWWPCQSNKLKKMNLETDYTTNKIRIKT